MLKTSRNETVVIVRENLRGEIEVVSHRHYDNEPQVILTLRHPGPYSVEMEIILPADSTIKVKKAVKETEIQPEMAAY